MSDLTYFASDYPFEEVKNPHVKLCSVNEALRQGAELSGWFLNGDIDRDKPNVILRIDDEKNFDEITIDPFDKSSTAGDWRTSFKYIAVLQWKYSEERAEQFLAYIRKHLEVSDKMEIWHVWSGDMYEMHEPKRRYIHVDDLTTGDFEKIVRTDAYENPECLTITR